MMKLFLLSVLTLTWLAAGYTLSRRHVFAGAAAFVPIAAVQALDACPPKSQNCIRTAWTPPPGTSKAEMAKTVKSVLSAYPQEGQAKVDMGGWNIVEDDLAGPSGTARVEFTSGIGNFAKFLNGGKPFIDDLNLKITDNAVEVRSSSRVGESDFGVNQKRLAYLGQGLAAAGWTVPEPKY